MPVNQHNKTEKRLIIIISESKIGIHHTLKSTDVQNEEIASFAFVFIPKLNKNGKFVHNLNTNKHYKEMLNYYKCSNAKRKDILIGYDLDENGEFMAHALQFILIKDGVSAWNIIRTPLTEKGYVVFKNFANINPYKKYVSLQEQFLNFLEIKKIKKIGFKKILALKHLTYFRQKMKKANKETFTIPSKSFIKMSGTSTITYLTKKMIELNNGK